MVLKEDLDHVSNGVAQRGMNLHHGTIPRLSRPHRVYEQPHPPARERLWERESLRTAPVEQSRDQRHERRPEAGMGIFAVKQRNRRSESAGLVGSLSICWAREHICGQPR